MTKYKFGIKGEEHVVSLLRQGGRDAHRTFERTPFDVIVDKRIRVEIKTRRPRHNNKEFCWRVTLERHRKLTEHLIDCYIFRLEGVPYHKSAIYLLFVPPLKVRVLRIGLRQLLQGRFKEAVENFNRFKTTGKLPVKNKSLQK